MKVETLPVGLQGLVDRVERSVRSRTGGMVRGLLVEIVDGQVVISGRTNTYYTKQLATHAALDESLELAISNDIEVC